MVPIGNKVKEEYYYCNSILKKEPETIKIITDQKKKKTTKQNKATLAKWLLESPGIPRIILGIPRNS